MSEPPHHHERQVVARPGPLAEAWERHAEEWIVWSRTPTHDSYERFHRDAFLDSSPGRAA